MFSSEEDGVGNDATKALDDPAVRTTVLGEPEKIKHLCGTLEADVSVFLLNSERSHPDGN
jgi:hypothetical protein